MLDELKQVLVHGDESDSKQLLVRVVTADDDSVYFRDVDIMISEYGIPLYDKDNQWELSMDFDDIEGVS